MQTYKQWFPIAEVPEYLAGTFVVQPHSNCLSVVCDGKFGNDRLLVLRFDSYEAIVTHEEFAHQWPGETTEPKLPKSPGGYWTFPFLIVGNSHWAATSARARALEKTPTHYCVLSGNDIVDILAMEPPRVLWASVEQVEGVLQAVEQLGGA